MKSRHKWYKRILRAQKTGFEVVGKWYRWQKYMKIKRQIGLD